MAREPTRTAQAKPEQAKGKPVRRSRTAHRIRWSVRLVPTALRLSNPVFRVSQSVEDGELNLAGLANRMARPPGKRANPPRVDAVDGSIIFAEHARATGVMRTLRVLNVSGSFTPI